MLELLTTWQFWLGVTIGFILGVLFTRWAMDWASEQVIGRALGW